MTIPWKKFGLSLALIGASGICLVDDKFALSTICFGLACVIPLLQNQITVFARFVRRKLRKQKVFDPHFDGHVVDADTVFHENPAEIHSF